MDRVSRPLLGVLVATVAFFALWIVALKPSPGGSSGSSTPTGLGRFNPAISAAHGAVATSNAASQAHGGTLPPGSPTGSSTAAPAPLSAAGVGSSTAAAAGGVMSTFAGRRPLTPGTAAAREAAVVKALSAHRVVAMLFYNPGGADDQAVRQELAAVPTRGGQVLKLAVPVAELARYPVVSAQISVMMSPTLVLIDRDQHAIVISGFADRFELTQRVADALSSA